MTRSEFLFLSLILCTTLALAAPQNALADAASDIQSQIDENNQQLNALKAEIASFQKQLDTLGTKKNTLQSTVSSLTLSQKKFAS